MKMNVAITGASGVVGRGLVEGLRTGEHKVYPLARGGGENSWDVKTGEIQTAGKIDILVNLAGRNIATRWTANAKKEIWDSRVTATQKLCEFLAKMPQPPRLLINASATGIYGNRGDEELTENSPLAKPGATFLSDICLAWEAATKPAENAGIRVVHLRLGVVLSKQGGALKKMITPVKFGLAGPVGRGTQFMPWISPADLQQLMVNLVESDTASGPINAVAGSVRQSAFILALGRVLHRPTVFPMPAFVVKLLFGQMGREVLLGSQRVKPQRATQFCDLHYKTVDDAIRAELAR